MLRPEDQVTHLDAEKAAQTLLEAEAKAAQTLLEAEAKAAEAKAAEVEAAEVEAAEAKETVVEPDEITEGAVEKTNEERVSAAIARLEEEAKKSWVRQLLTAGNVASRTTTKLKELKQATGEDVEKVLAMHRSIVFFIFQLFKVETKSQVKALREPEEVTKQTASASNPLVAGLASLGHSAYNAARTSVTSLFARNKKDDDDEKSTVSSVITAKNGA